MSRGRSTLEKWRRTAVIAFGILLAGALAALCVTGRITREVVSENKVAYEQMLESIAFGFQAKQDFVPQHEYLDSVKVHVDASGCAREQGELRFGILDASGEQVFSGAVPVAELPQFGWAEASIHTRLAPGQVYTLVLESVGCVDNGPKISFVDAGLAASTEQQAFHLVYAGVETEDSALQVSFVYAVPIEWYEYLAYYIFGLLMLAMVIS